MHTDAKSKAVFHTSSLTASLALSVVQLWIILITTEINSLGHAQSLPEDM